MSDAGLIELAAAHLRAAALCPAGSARRRAEQAEFRRAYAEFGRREDVRALRRLGPASAWYRGR